MKNISFVFIIIFILSTVYAEDKTKQPCDTELQQLYCPSNQKQTDSYYSECQALKLCINQAASDTSADFQTQLQNKCNPKTQNRQFILYYNQYLSCTWTNSSNILISSAILLILSIIF
ncbi:hypothetical protein TTHERM_000035658 (macronuclear) [Tetrahymena thermophila SB210]|uniref:Transmembrane protein n=1 Tax=Tetrahymena thermophila (strain SB210) TaxID=312017 RepID=W7X687_TETTS|nr:hypothetical protein TTHERM_000035658 [Tetrahymena thermophila SB210]EWS74880.1 hypothetical protein TTHERM_000035658 [Tetrahymena thermophila SB210]|eukprot:XP_012652593.1 hypothetical protein TTHERM_000035658 [Tetrahymena thermophila SB210]